MTALADSATGTPIFSSSALNDGVTVFEGIVMPVPLRMAAMSEATSESGITLTILLYLLRITFLGLPSFASFELTGPDFHSTSPTASLAFSALYPEVSSLSGISTSTVTRLFLLYAEENWSLSGDLEECQYGLYAAFTLVRDLPVLGSFPPLSRVNLYFGLPSESVFCSPVLLSMSGIARSGFSSALYHLPISDAWTLSPATTAAIGGYSFPSMSCIAL